MRGGTRSIIYQALEVHGIDASVGCSFINACVRASCTLVWRAYHLSSSRMPRSFTCKSSFYHANQQHNTMALTKTLLLTAAAASSVAAQAVIPYVTLYEDAYFQGAGYTMEPWYESCHNVEGTYFKNFNDIASSAQWYNYPASYNGVIWFYRDADCRGGGLGWRLQENNFPNNFAVDGINDMISSVQVRPYSGIRGVGIESVDANAAQNATEALNGTTAAFVVDENGVITELRHN